MQVHRCYLPLISFDLDLYVTVVETKFGPAKSFMSFPCIMYIVYVRLGHFQMALDWPLPRLTVSQRARGSENSWVPVILERATVALVAVTNTSRLGSSSSFLTACYKRVNCCKRPSTDATERKASEEANVRPVWFD